MRSRSWLLAAAVACTLATPPAGARGQEDVARAKQVYARAIQLDARGDHAGALSLLWEAAGLAPGDPEVQNRLGEALERMGALDAAVEHYRRAAAGRSPYEKATNNLILALVKSGRGPEAVARAQALVAASPGDATRYFTLGLAQSEQDVVGSLATFRRVLDLSPRHALARYNLALVLQRLDRLEEAAVELRAVLDLEPRPRVHCALGVIYWHQGDLDRAMRELRAALSADPDYYDAHVALGAVLKERRDWRGAAGALRRAIQLRPDASAAHVTLGGVLRLAGDEEAARAHLSEGERLRARGEREQEALVRTSVGTRKLEAGDLVGALDQFRSAVAVLESYAPAYYQMGLALQRLDHREAARAAFARARQLNPGLVPPPGAP